ncbi:hypothetical protein RSAG8_04149, partial [Rhizoctonia solani AG-8 WAC10335]
MLDQYTFAFSTVVQRFPTVTIFFASPHSFPSITSAGYGRHIYFNTVGFEVQRQRRQTLGEYLD